MISRAYRRAVVLFAVLAASLALAGARQVPAPGHAPALADRLTDQQFWHLVTDLSEPNGFFDSDNLVSNEDTFQTVIPDLTKTVPAGRAYLGVGPDQNFAYIVALAPRLSFITDIRRGNLHVHLMYKALIELSADRAEFLSRLFARPRPARLGSSASADDLLRAIGAAPLDRTLLAENERAIADVLTKRHGFTLASGDLPAIMSVYTDFATSGPGIRFVSSRPGNWYPSYTDLQTSTDAIGVNRGYLASEDLFRRLKAAEEENAIVPLVGNFAGPRAIRGIGAYLKAHGTTVGAFYTSNVEQYLFQQGAWSDFMANVAALPLDTSSTFIRSCFNSCSAPGGSRAVTLVDSMTGLLKDNAAGRIRRYGDVLLHSHPH